MYTNVAVIMAQPLWEFTRFVWWMQHNFGTSKSAVGPYLYSSAVLHSSNEPGELSQYYSTVKIIIITVIFVLLIIVIIHSYLN